MKPLPAASETDLFFCWDANRVDIGGKKLLIMTNSSNRLCAITRMAGFEWKKIAELAPQLMANAMATAGMSDKEYHYHAYMQAAGDIVLTKTHGSKPLGRLAEIQNTLWPEDVDMSDKTQLFQMARYNTLMIGHCATRKDYEYPYEWFPDDLRTRRIAS